MAVAAGVQHTCALLEDRSIKCWGRNKNGQLGNGTFTGVPPFGLSTPVAVIGISTATALAAGFHSCALLEDGTIRCWGDNQRGELGIGTFTGLPNFGISTPVQVPGISTATVIGTGFFHTCAQLSNGQILCWGKNRSGQLGNGTFTFTSPFGIAFPVNVIGF